MARLETRELVHAEDMAGPLGGGMETLRAASWAPVLNFRSGSRW
jgi:hypothetical protein